MNARIKQLRLKYGLTQEEFADAIGVKQNTVASYESGRITPSPSVVSLICREFNVNEDWIRSGQGDMFAEKNNLALKALSEQYELSDSATEFIADFCGLNPDAQELIINFVYRNLLTKKEPSK